MRSNSPLVGLVVALSLGSVVAPASAGLMPYTFTAEIDGLDPLVADLLSVEIGDTISGGFLFDFDAPRTSFSQCDDCNYDGSVFIPGVRTNATYDMSDLLLWAAVGNRVLGATGDTLKIQDVPTGTYAPDSWHLDTVAWGQDIGAGVYTEDILIRLNSWFRGPLSNGDLQVPIPTEFEAGPFWDNRLLFHFSDPFGLSRGIGSHLTSITSVPEPNTLFLLGAGLLAMCLRRRRKTGA